MRSLSARPFLKWAGGKGQLLDTLMPRLPSDLGSGSVRRYVEPFLGGGAVFFAVAEAYSPEESFLFDVNRELVLTYRAVQQDVERLIEELRALETTYLPLSDDERRGFYYGLRERFNRAEGSAASTPVARAAEFLFLNRTCFNGLFRVNSRGRFNVPPGRYQNPRILDEGNLRAVSGLLARVTIRQGDFTESLPVVDEQTFIYIDPPYRPLSTTAKFTSYARDAFTDADQIRLAEFCRKVDAAGARFMLSNSDPRNTDPDDSFFDDLYSGFSISRVSARRAINRNPDGRGSLTEIVVTNF